MVGGMRLKNAASIKATPNVDGDQPQDTSWKKQFIFLVK